MITCSICLELFNIKLCINTWLLQNNTCPYCRKVIIDNNNLSPINNNNIHSLINITNYIDDKNYINIVDNNYIHNFTKYIIINDTLE
jgi:hypothetical protein